VAHIGSSSDEGGSGGAEDYTLSVHLIVSHDSSLWHLNSHT
jgi:hypothetical protein